MTTETEAVFLIYTSSFKGDEAFVMSCDNDALKWLSDKFETAMPGERVVFGDGKPICSDEKCMIDVMFCEGEQISTINQVADGQFLWIISIDESQINHDKIDTMIASKMAGHQYCDAENIEIVITKGEYTVESLRLMR